MLKAQKKIKINSKEIRHDELLTLFEKVSVWYYDNAQKVNIAAIVLLVAIAGTIFYIYNVRSNNEIASKEFGKIFSYYDKGDYKIAIDGIKDKKINGLKQIAEEFDGTDAGEIAEFYLANSYLVSEKYSEAKKHFENCNTSNSLLKSATLSGIAQCYESEKNYLEAAKNFEQAATYTKENYLNAEYLFHSAMNFANAGEKEKGIEILKRIRIDFPKSEISRDIDRYIAEISY